MRFFPAANSFASTRIDNIIESLLTVQVLVLLWHFFNLQSTDEEQNTMTVRFSQDVL